MPRTYNSQQTVERILTVASQLFLEKGFEKTSMSEIVAQLGMSKGAIYHHFKSKEEIVNAVLAQQAEGMEAVFTSWLANIDAANAREKLVALLERNLTELAEQQLNDVYNTQAKSAEFIVTNMRATIEKSAPLFAQIIAEGIEDGSLPTEQPEEVAEMFLLLLNIWCDPAVFNDGKLAARLRFVQRLMRALHVDVLSDSFIERTERFIVQLQTEGE